MISNAFTTLTLTDAVRFRSASGEARFFDPVNMCITDNTECSTDGKGTWVTLPAGAEVMLVASYTKADTYMLIVNEVGAVAQPSDDTYGLVVRELSMQKILEKAAVEVVDVAQVQAAEEAAA